MRVLVLAPYPLRRNPSQRFRWEQYIVPLQARGIWLEPSSFLDEAALTVVHAGGAWGAKAAVVLTGAGRRLRDALRARRYDLVLIHRESAPVGPAWIERILAASKVPYAFDFDDAVYLANVSEANRRLAWLKGSAKTRTVVRRASLVLAGNEHLRDWASTLNRRVRVVPTTIDTDLYRPAPPQAGRSLCIGWSGSMSTIEHLRLLEPVLSSVQAEHGVRIRVIGDETYRVPGAEVESLPWREATELEDLRRIDIGVMPLPDDEWARGKCGLKALQYMALGIPTVMSPVGVNRRIARDGAALLATTEDEWRQALGRLIVNPELRAAIGRAGRRRVQQEYSVDAVLPVWESALREAADA